LDLGIECAGGSEEHGGNLTNLKILLNPTKIS
jgi:hypothetical protein